MHGDFSQPRNAVLTKEDYETYNEHRALFSEKLKGDLIEKTFLFLGFSFTDPNVDYILAPDPRPAGAESAGALLHHDAAPDSQGRGTGESPIQT